MSVDLDNDVMLGAGTQHFLDVDFVAWPPLELAPGHVSDHGSMRMRDGPKQTHRLRFAVQFEPAMDARDHEIEAFQHVVLIIERSVRQNVGLDAFEDSEILGEAFVQAVGFQVLLRDLLDREAAGIVRGLGMVGNPEILETTLARSFGHGLQGFGAVRRIRVAVKDPAQVLVVYELWQLALQSQLKLTPPLPEF